MKILDGITEESVTRVQIRKNLLLHQEVRPEENLQELRKNLKMRPPRKSKTLNTRAQLSHYVMRKLLRNDSFSSSVHQGAREKPRRRHLKKLRRKHDQVEL